ncbi:winged helix-turn-helix domain-containing protein [Nisaea sediminum]|uniref:winged helix-turn-helix domain-containing protein n=1 Tax=Nisaea sediminum TaxID=2775867 RepID=UPI001868E814|nr:winged helix-turn-helix domain-containing protein [Nisaea sediminum]
MRYLFGDFVLDTGRVELLARGRPVPLEKKSFEILTYLIEHRDRVVPKEELLEIGWDGRIVSDTALSSQIKAIRRVLGDDGRTQRVLRTRHGVGFHFVAGVTVEAPDATGGAPAPVPVSAVPRHAKPAIAVLPFKNLSSDEALKHFADGLAEDVITGLAGIGRFDVAPRSSSFAPRLRALTAREAAAELGVQFILEGAVRLFGDRIRVTGELIDAAAETQLWNERYDRRYEDGFALQDEIAAEIVSRVGRDLGGDGADEARQDA